MSMSVRRMKLHFSCKLFRLQENCIGISRYCCIVFTFKLPLHSLVSFAFPYFIEINRIMADKPKVDLGLLEEDDEFEEFPAENWGAEDVDDEDVSVWEDNWEDDIVQDDFSQQLRQQLEKLKEQNKA